VARDPGHIVEHQNPPGGPGLPESSGATRDGARQGEENVVELTEVPAGLPGRPSKAMTAQQADDVITKTASDRMHSYIVVSLLTGARTEELRALR
jgi:hypothetical protein